MQNEENKNLWPAIESKLRRDSEYKDEFPPFLHNRIMASVLEESELSSQPKWVVFSSFRLALAGGLVGLVTACFLFLSNPYSEDSLNSQALGEMIIIASHSHQEMSAFISKNRLDYLVTQPYQNQLNSIAKEFENALDFTIKMMPIEIARN